MKQLLNQESPDELDRMMRYYRYFSESRLEVLGEYQSTLTEIEQTNQALSTQHEQQAAQRNALTAERLRLAEERDTRAGLIEKLDLESETKSEEYDRLLKDRERLESLLAELRRRTLELDGSAFEAARGSLPMPISGPIRHAFGAPRADNRLRWHGLDIEANDGDSVAAVFRGRVIFSDWLRGFGLLTILDHGSGYMSLYGHVDALYKKPGDWVESGEPIAIAGSSGGTAFSGVYFEIRHDGEPQDPIRWIRR